MTTHIHFIHPQKIVWIGWGHHVEFCVWKIGHYFWRRVYASVKCAIIGSDNGLSPSRRQAIIQTNARILLIRPLGINLSELLIEINIFSFQANVFENGVWEMASISFRPQCVNIEGWYIMRTHNGTYCMFAAMKLATHQCRGMIMYIMRTRNSISGAFSIFCIGLTSSKIHRTSCRGQLECDDTLKQEPKWTPSSPAFDKHSNIEQHVWKIQHNRTRFYQGKICSKVLKYSGYVKMF